VTGLLSSVNVKPIDDLLGPGAVDQDPATLPAMLTDYDHGGAKVRTFGHRLSDSNPKAAAPGGRYREFPAESNDFAVGGGIACDAKSSLVFYVQAPNPGGGPAWVVVVD
jgi:hypothetical protein